MTTQRHAVVIGAGMAGLLAARVLSDSFERVTVLDRDTLESDGGPRRGVPHGPHIHGLQLRGGQIAEELFPGLQSELAAAGAPLITSMDRLHFRNAGLLLSREPQPLPPVAVATRPFLEWLIRDRVAALPGVQFRDRTDVLRPVADMSSGNARVRGVQVVGSDGIGGTIDADLVVDASGRGSRAPAWLQELGYQRPAEERLVVRISYASQQVRLPAGNYPADLLIEGRPPGEPYGMALFACERRTWTFTVVGRGVRAPRTLPDMLRTSATIAPEWVTEALHGAQPVGQVALYGHPVSLRRRYETLRRVPAGFIVLGDAMCSFNPVYGQGMTVAACQAMVLARAVAAGTGDDLPRRYFRAAAQPTGTAWRMSSGADLLRPDVAGPRPLGVRLRNRYLRRILLAAQQNGEIARRFFRVAGLLDAPAALLAPSMLRAAVQAHAPQPPALQPSREGSARSQVSCSPATSPAP
jgi:2-polyprenyl-6-methoxyphenol hydroxylase-like FAD-dependent oxidoreductase